MEAEAPERNEDEDEIPRRTMNSEVNLEEMGESRADAGDIVSACRKPYLWLHVTCSASVFG